MYEKEKRSVTVGPGADRIKLAQMAARPDSPSKRSQVVTETNPAGADQIRGAGETGGGVVETARGSARSMNVPRQNWHRVLSALMQKNNIGSLGSDPRVSFRFATA